MLKLDNFPKNKDKFLRLIEFFKEILDICKALNITPIVDGGIAVFVYTKNSNLVVNDIDVGFPEVEFQRIMKALDDKRIKYKLREWHVLQVLRDDLKIELGSIEYWYKDLPIECEVLQIDDYEVKILSSNSLKELYKRGIDYFADKIDKTDIAKFDAYKVKYHTLNSISQKY